MQNQSDSPKILVIQLKMIGDVLASSIICQNLREKYPDARIDYLIYPFTRPVVEHNPHIDNLVLFDEGTRKDKIRLLKFIRDIRRRRYDIVIDAYGKLESYLATRFSGAPVRVGFKKRFAGLIYSHMVENGPATSAAGAALDNRLKLVRAIYPGASHVRPRIWLTDQETAAGRQRMYAHGIGPADTVYMISVLGSSADKTYPAGYMARLLDAMAAESNPLFLFNYMPSQSDQARAVFDLCQPATQQRIRIDLIPGSIREFLAITSHCTALIGNEGGAVNMAKAIGIRTFTVFSPWINRSSWNSFEDGKTHLSVHLRDIKPQLYGEGSAKRAKSKAIELYRELTPDLVLAELLPYLRRN